MSASYRGRLAPSPTGYMHLGVARTSLVAWLRARAVGGALVLRIEDIDAPRVVPGAAHAILGELRWLGLDWDEGPDVGGPHAPYTQLARLTLYTQAIEQLRATGLVYACTCSRKEIAQIASAPHGDLGPLYPGTCRNAPSHSGRPAALRFRMPEPAPSFVDGLQGSYAAGVADDFVLRRSDGVYAYQLAVVVDDLAMGITEVVRGDDLLSSTPRQIALYRAFGAREPAFFHVPLVLDADGRRMSKRFGSMSVTQCRQAGATPEQVIGVLAHTLGLAAPHETLTAAQLVTRFDPSKLPTSATQLDTAQLFLQAQT
ncbi:MAG TPA: tRNA glutamyl-Q(34) synthetase GluQRS [Polyangiales bacterium]